MKAICFEVALGVVALLASRGAHAEDHGASAGEIIGLISQYRHEHGLPPVRVDPRLTAVAERQAHAMADSGIMDHDVAAPFGRRIAGADTDSAGENIAAGSKTWPDTLRMWKNSPGHNANLLLSGADIIGVAVARNEQTRYKTFWAMVIGHRRSAPARGKQRIVGEPEIRVENPASAGADWVGGIFSAGRKAIFGE